LPVSITAAIGHLFVHADDTSAKSKKPGQSIAIALEHEAGSEATPRVVASGRGFTADRILELAFANGVKVREDADLAEMLAAVDIGAEIPFAAFAAVAEILSYMYGANQAAGTDPAASTKAGGR
jgi:flagellar biosynthesis protein